MTWNIEFGPAALKELKKLDRVAQKRIIGFLNERLLAKDDPRALGKALQGSRFDNFWRFRVGDYRIISHIDEEVITITVVKIGHRRDIYK